MMIRSATPEDVPGVLPMVRKIAAFHAAMDPAKYQTRGDPGEPYDGWLRSRATDPRSVFLVAESANDSAAPPLVGFLVASVEKEIPIYRLREFGLIHDLWVDEDYRHEGLARQMVTLALERFVQIGVEQVRLYAAWDNAPARALFDRCGFRPSSVEMLWQGRPAPVSPENS